MPFVRDAGSAWPITRDLPLLPPFRDGPLHVGNIPRRSIFPTDEIAGTLRPFPCNSDPPAVLIVAYFIFMANLLFGAAVKAGIIDNRRFRIVHHLLYLLVVVSLLSATLITLMRGDRGGYAMGAMAGLLLCMPLFRGRSRGHWMFATFCAVLYSALLALRIWR